MDKWITLVKARMRELKLTQEKLAERLGVTQGAVGHWLRNDREPPLRRMNEVLEALGIGHLKMNASCELGEPAALYGPAATAVFHYPRSDWQRLGDEGEDRDEPAQLTDYQAEGLAYWLTVEGDAMTAPVGMSVSEGMLILVDSGLSASAGALVIARLPGNPTGVFRQLIEEGGQRYLRPLNPTYPKIMLSAECELLGVVVQALIKFS